MTADVAMLEQMKQTTTAPAEEAREGQKMPMEQNIQGEVEI